VPFIKLNYLPYISIIYENDDGVQNRTV